MTDKLADALKAMPNLIRLAHTYDGCEKDAWMFLIFHGQTVVDTLKQAITTHEAAKAATPDDVREAVDARAAMDSPAEAFDKLLQSWKLGWAYHQPSVLTWANTVEAALRQGVTLPREVELDDVLAWADGVMGDLGTEYANRVTEKEARIAYCILQCSPNYISADTAAKIKDAIVSMRSYVSKDDVGQIIMREANEALAILDQHARGG